MTPVEDVRSAKPEDRLAVAMYYLEALTDFGEAHLDHYYFKFGLHSDKARFIHFMALNCGRACTYDQVWALYPEVSRKTVTVIVCVARKKIRPFAEIQSVPGIGWKMSREEAEKVLPPPIEESPVYPSRQGRPWTRSETQDLRRMSRGHSTISDIAKKLRRTERAILERLVLAS